ncbi:DNA sulfur modification protein DndE [Nodosilinea nodulosa]|uniref:DNA sulfur modification protein DndE n=1 Tax=Nodosilinea nodulosa TaxID=416001 RepID=UPI0008FB902B|nr:DNA sulfur modification protein DndE [Nodosilinea nodulosa]
MEPPVERVRVSESAKDQLTKLKRITKIDQWNILCRWAFCCSLAEPSKPSLVMFTTDSNIEMTWQVFGGAIADELTLALKQRCHDDHLDSNRETLAQQFRLHLHRGIGYLASNSDLKSVGSLVSLAVRASSGDVQ